MEPHPVRSALVVDDYEPNRVLIQDLLEMHGYRVFGASDGRAALRMLAVVRPSVILLDMRMPSMDGPQFLRSLQEDAALSRIPVVVVTGDRSARAPGATAIVNKPFDLGHLLEIVQRAC